MPELHEAALGAALRAIDAPPSQPDLAALVAAGRRRDRLRRAVAAGGVFAAVTAATILGTLVVVTHRAGLEPVAPPLTSCVAGRPAPAIAHGLYIGAVDPTLRYVAGLVLAGGTGPLAQGGTFLWDNGVAHAIPSPDAGSEPGQALGVNSRGWLAGMGGTIGADLGHDVAMLYRDGKSTRLPLPAGHDAGIAYSINTRGDVVGSATAGPDPTRTALLWPAAQPESPVTLPIPASAVGAEAMAINDAGVIGGALGRGQGFHIPYVWTSPSTGYALRVPDGFAGGSVQIMRGDLAAGFLEKPGAATDGRVPAEWDLRTGAVSVAPDDVEGTVGAIDTAGRFVVNQARLDRHPHPSHLVQPGGPTIELAASSGTIGLYAQIHGMSDDGHVLVGQLVDYRGMPASGLTIWTCS